MYMLVAIASSIMREGAHIQIFVFCTINLFLDQLFLQSVNTNI